MRFCLRFVTDHWVQIFDRNNNGKTEVEINLPCVSYYVKRLRRSAACEWSCSCMRKGSKWPRGELEADFSLLGNFIAMILDQCSKISSPSAKCWQSDSLAIRKQLELPRKMVREFLDLIRILRMEYIFRSIFLP